MYRTSWCYATVLAAAVLHAGCRDKTSGSATAGTPPPPGCPVCAAAPGAGALAEQDMEETSGLAASALHEGVFYAHNDSGDSPRFFAIDRTGAVRGTFRVAGAGAIDWEDMARGPCQAGDPASGSCLYFGDIGDNREVRSDCAVYRVREPSAMAAGQELSAEMLPFHYPDGSHNAEALLVHPMTGVITIVTKVGSGDSTIFEFPMPLVPGKPAVLKKIGNRSLPEGSPKVTGGAVHPKGKGVLIRTYTHLFYFPMTATQSVAEALSGAPCPMPVAEEAQGEAVAFFASGEGYMTISEGKKVSVNRFECRGL